MDLFGTSSSPSPLGVQTPPPPSSLGFMKERYVGYNIRKESEKTIGSEEVNVHRRHILIMTEVGRPVYTRFGEEMEASSFVATMGAILEKYRIFFFHDVNRASKWQKMVINKKEIHFIKRKQLMYICVNDVAESQRSTILPSSRAAFLDSAHASFPNAANHQQSLVADECSQFAINSMLDFLNVQMISILTDQVNAKLQSRPNYDPQQTLGDRNQLIGTAIKNGLHSPCVMLNSYMALPLTSAHRKAVHSVLGEAQGQTGAIVVMLTTPNYVVDIFKQKGFEFGVGDILLIQNLLQAQGSLRHSHNWIPLCLPGMSADGLIYAYISFLVEGGGDLALVMISDSNELFFKCKDAQQMIVEKLKTQIFPVVSASLGSLPYTQRISSNQSTVIKHFVIQQCETRQLTLPCFVPFGKQPKEFKKYMMKYGRQFEKYLAADQQGKQDYFSVSRDEQDHTGMYATADFLILFVLDKFVAVPEIHAQLTLLLKWIKVEEQIKFISKFS